MHPLMMWAVREDAQDNMRWITTRQICLKYTQILYKWYVPLEITIIVFQGTRKQTQHVSYVEILWVW